MFVDNGLDDAEPQTTAVGTVGIKWPGHLAEVPGGDSPAMITDADDAERRAALHINLYRSAVLDGLDGIHQHVHQCLLRPLFVDGDAYVPVRLAVGDLDITRL